MNGRALLSRNEAKYRGDSKQEQGRSWAALEIGCGKVTRMGDGSARNETNCKSPKGWLQD